MLGKGVDDDDDDANKEMEKDGADTEIEREGGRAFALIIVIIHPLSWQETSAQGGGKVWAHIERSLVCMCVRVCVYTQSMPEKSLFWKRVSLFFLPTLPSHCFVMHQKTTVRWRQESTERAHTRGGEMRRWIWKI